MKLRNIIFFQHFCFIYNCFNKIIFVIYFIDTFKLNYIFSKISNGNLFARSYFNIVKGNITF